MDVPLMWHGVSSRFLDAIRYGGPEHVVRVDAYWRGRHVGQDLKVTGGSVTVDAGSQVRRQLSITFARDAALWEMLKPTGVELYVWRGIKFHGTAQPELVPLGVFVVDSQRMSIGPDGGLSLTCPDRWALVQRARFPAPHVSRAGVYATAEIARLVREAVPPVPAVEIRTRIPQGVTGELTATTVWQRDRDEAILTMQRADGLDGAFAPDGAYLIRRQPSLSDGVVWHVNAGRGGVLLDGDRERNRSRTYNSVIVSATRADGTEPFPPVTVEDNDPSSPTYVGRYGRVPYFLNNPLLRTIDHANRAGRAALDRVRGLAAQASVEATPNPALDAGDVIEVTVDPLTGATERHIIDTLTVPLDPETRQQITTRSTRPEGDVADEAPVTVGV